MSTCFPQALQFSNQSRMSSFNHVVENQLDKLQSPQPLKHLAHQGCVLHYLKSSDGPLIPLLRQDYSQAFLQRPSKPSVLSSLWSLPFLLTDAKLSLPFLISHISEQPYLPVGPSSCLFDTSHRAALSFIKAYAHDYLSDYTVNLLKMRATSHGCF